MAYILIPLVIILMALVVISLFRGLNAFRQGLGEENGSDPTSGATQLQLKQNKMMWARIKYQLAAILVVVVLMMMAR
ncbi:MAG: HIG1 domain-containing protein [Novosphingobium sp.]|nr:HIG1 domain-containing protein [Novosphingobium sp.]